MTQRTGAGAAAQAHVVVIGAGAAGRGAGAQLLAAGITDFVILDKTPQARPDWPAALDGHLRPGREVIAAVFDDNTDTWTLSTDGGQPFRGRIVVAAHRPAYVPWIPDFPGRNDFRGESFHAAAWNPAFDAAGKRIAVVGTDAAAGHHIGRLMHSAASVTVFAHAPRRVVSEVPLRTIRAKRRLSRHTRGKQARRAPLVAESAIDAVTFSGIRTNDGVDHLADAIIYGTGFAIPDQMLVGARGLTIQQAWDDGMEPFLGVAVHGFPNYFFTAGPDIGAQIRYVVECLDLMERTASTRIEVRRSSQQVFNERAQLKPAPPHRAFKAFDLSSSAPDADDTYDGAATLEIGGSRHSVHVRLTGHLDPIDGNYHWQGTVLDPLPQDSLTQARAGTLTVGERSAPARIIEQTPWGTHSVAGLGAPPYACSGP